MLLLSSKKNRLHRRDKCGKALDLGAELPPASRRQAVDPRLPSQLAHPPLGLDPSDLLQAIERRIQRPLLDLDGVAGGLAQPSGDGVTMSWPPAQRLENQGVEGAM